MANHQSNLIFESAKPMFLQLALLYVEKNGHLRFSIEICLFQKQDAKCAGS